MSTENERTVEVYKQKANTYLATSIKHDNVNLDKAKCKREKLNNFIKTNIESLPKSSKVFEIGSGDGSNAKYIESLGYNVIASDVAEDFITAINKKRIKINQIQRINRQIYRKIFCYFLLESICTLH